MGVDVDKSGCDKLTGRVDFFTARCTDLTNSSDKATIDRNIGQKAGRACAIHYSSAANNQIMHADSPLSSERAYQL
jgi:hypothetical protein